MPFPWHVTHYRGFCRALANRQTRAARPRHRARSSHTTYTSRSTGLNQRLQRQFRNDHWTIHCSTLVHRHSTVRPPYLSTGAETRRCLGPLICVSAANQWSDSRTAPREANNSPTQSVAHCIRPPVMCDECLSAHQTKTQHSSPAPRTDARSSPPSEMPLLQYVDSSPALLARPPVLRLSAIPLPHRLPMLAQTRAASR